MTPLSFEALIPLLKLGEGGIHPASESIHLEGLPVALAELESRDAGSRQDGRGSFHYHAKWIDGVQECRIPTDIMPRNT